MRNFLEEFKKFALRGNVVDLAVAVVVGGAFGRITTSLVDNIIMPLIGILVGGIDFSELTLTVRGAEIGYGVFLQTIVNFIIIAFAIFVAIRLMNNLHRRQSEAPENKKVEPTEEVKLLREIRDELRK